MMNNGMTIKYKKDNSIGVEVVELPFKGRRFNFYIALPKKMDGIIALGMLIFLSQKMS